MKQQLRDKLGTTLIIDAFGVSEAGHQGMNLGAQRNRTPSLFSVDPFDRGPRRRPQPVEPGSATGRHARAMRPPASRLLERCGKDRSHVPSPMPKARRWVIPGDMATVEADGT